jgi:hypothetical protein
VTLFEINEQIQKAIELGFDPDTGEILDASALEQLQIDRDEKIENICLYIKDLTAEAKALADEAKALSERKERSAKKAESLKNYLQAMLDGQKWKSSKAAVSYRKTQSVVVDDLEALKPEFLRIKKEADKTAIKEVLKAGAAVSGAHLEEKQSMSIK